MLRIVLPTVAPRGQLRRPVCTSCSADTANATRPACSADTSGTTWAAYSTGTANSSHATGTANSTHATARR